MTFVSRCGNSKGDGAARGDVSPRDHGPGKGRSKPCGRRQCGDGRGREGVIAISARKKAARWRVERVRAAWRRRKRRLLSQATCLTLARDEGVFAVLGTTSRLSQAPVFEYS